MNVTPAAQPARHRPPTWLFAGLVSVTVTLLAMAFVAPATAQDSPSGRSLVQRVDASTPGSLTIDFIADGEGSVPVGLSIDGADGSEGAPIEPVRSPEIVVVVDDVVSGQAAGGLSSVIAAAEAVTDGLASGSITLVSAGTPARIIEGSVAGLSGREGGSSIRDALVLAGEASAEQGAAPIVVISGTADASSTASASRARGVVAASGAPVFTISLPGADSTLSTLATFDRHSVGSVEDATAAGEAVRSLAGRQFSATFPTGDLGDTAALTLHVGETDHHLQYAEGTILSGRQAVVPTPVERGTALPGFAKWIAAALACLAVGAVAYMVGSAVFREDTALASAMRAYGQLPEEDAVDDALATNAILQRAVDLTEDIAERQGVLAKVEEALDEARLALRPAEALFFTFAAALVGAALGFLMRGPVGAVLGLGFVLAFPVVFVRMKAKRRRDKFVAQLPDMLTLLSSTLKAGYSLGQGLDAVSKEIDDPMGAELRRAVTEAQLGRPIDESLESVSERMGSDDFTWAVMAIKIQKEVGGNLAELLLTVAETMTLRSRLLGEVKALTAEGRMSAYVISILPPGLGVVMYTLNPGYVGTMFENTGGMIALGAASVWAVFGFVWMQKIVNIKV